MPIGRDPRAAGIVWTTVLKSLRPSAVLTAWMPMMTVRSTWPSSSGAKNAEAALEFHWHDAILGAHVPGPWAAPAHQTSAPGLRPLIDLHPTTLPYMFHCHILAHEDDGMMGISSSSTPTPRRPTSKTPARTRSH